MKLKFNIAAAIYKNVVEGVIEGFDVVTTKIKKPENADVDVSSSLMVELIAASVMRSLSEIIDFEDGEVTEKMETIREDAEQGVYE